MDDSAIRKVKWFFAGTENLKMVAELVLLCAGLVALFSRDALVIDKHIDLSVSIVYLL